ncbi:MAG: tRNA (adenine-N1)-methyltransferase [Nitriliruptorales bacterium]|nr:tRNA (adenine-N1)-methyltransferase [Nitriliruptorales bacterium]
MGDAGAVVPGDREPLAAGELVVLRDRKDRRYLLTLEEGGEWHSHAGLIRHDDLVGSPEASRHRTSMGMEVIVFRPTREDYVLKMPRGAQVIYPKDQAMILARADIRAGSTVVEAGAGSGALTLALLDAVGPTGRVVSYEVREDHLEVARANVHTWHGGHPDNWEAHLGDVGQALPSLAAHRVVLDMLKPWEMVDGVAKALSPGGAVLAYMPTITQVMRFVETLEEDGRFADVQTTETFLRDWDVAGLSVRPAHRMVAHTAFLTTARRAAPDRDEDTA